MLPNTTKLNIGGMGSNNNTTSTKTDESVLLVLASIEPDSGMSTVMERKTLYSISPIVSFISLTLMGSYVVALISPSVYVFASVTNLCYIAAGYQRAWFDIFSAVKKTNQVFNISVMASLVYTLLGASSLAFHVNVKMMSPAHSFDILFGWALVLHVAYVCIAVCLLLMATKVGNNTPTVRKQTIELLVVVGFLTTIVVTIVLYDTIYLNQLIFFLTVGGCASICGGICRFLLVKADEKNRSQIYAWGYAILEIVVALTMTLAAVIAQCNLLGIKYSHEDPQYDFYHGQWHALLAMVTALLYSRAIAASNNVGETKPTVCICELPKLDLFAIVTLFVYSLLVIITKETRMDLSTAKVLLAFPLGALLIHSLAYLFQN